MFQRGYRKTSSQRKTAQSVACSRQSYGSGPVDAQRDQDVIEGVATGRPGSVPGYLLAALMHCPKLLEGISDGDWRHFEGEERAEELAESDRTQKALVLVADRKACEEGEPLSEIVDNEDEDGRLTLVCGAPQAQDAAQDAARGPVGRSGLAVRGGPG
ncbi:hypothetical protein PCH_Pc13g02650 [Penicillium rubens Wisconsin 54-1255]|uniref:Uncharacterized protein n=1 Tax=Penicillium rubens (strain ATCC 28089 / DSM 1075 / NRRL 1951 / Wisconsin 54-1255) TaxID=500485 RepID=B6H1D2_PENRW|nr:hypothetical protein PCH_Pc13g02650 [Penicillium rubens Wisconsin 54-1255]